MTLEKIHRASDKRLRDQITARLRELEAQIAASSGLVSDTAYDATSWNGVTTVAPSKNAVRDELEAIKADYVPDTGNTTIAGVKTFSSDPLIPDEEFNPAWDGALEPVTKNSMYDFFFGRYAPAAMLLDGSTSYYSDQYTSSGNKITVVGRFYASTFTGNTNQQLLRAQGPGGRARVSILIGSSDNATVGFQNKLRAAVENSAGTTICRVISPDSVVELGFLTYFFSFDGDAGTATFYIAGADADDTGNASRIAPTTGTLDSGALSSFYIGANGTPALFFLGGLGFTGYRDAYLTNWSDFMDAYGFPKVISSLLWAEWGAQPAFWNPHGQMSYNLGSAGDMAAHGLITLQLPGFQGQAGLEYQTPGPSAYGQLTSNYTLTSTTSVQKLFNWSANGALTLAAGRYYFRCLFYITTMSGTSGNGSFRLVGGGTATVSDILYHTVGVDDTSPLTVLARSGTASITEAGPASMATANVGTGLVAETSGYFNVTAAGTIIPSIALVTAAAAVVQAGSTFVCWRVADTGINTVGAWT